MIAKRLLRGSPMTALRLLRFRALAARRRLAGGGTLLGVLGSAALVLAGALVVLALDRTAGSDVAGAGGSDALFRVSRDRAFWLAALEVLVFAYTTFEVLFRAGDTAFVSLLPLRGRDRWLELGLRAAALHAALLLPSLAYAAGLLRRGEPAAGLHAASLGLAAFLVGLPASSWLHLLAGRSLLGEATALRKSLGGGHVPAEAAYLLWSPAAGLAVTLVSVVLLDAFSARALAAGASPAALFAGSAAVSAGAAVWIVRRSAADADRVLPLVVARFVEIDVAPPGTEKGGAEPVPGERLAPLLPLASRPFFLRDLRQLRRRHRLDRIVLWVFAAAMVRLGLVSGDPAEVARHGLAAFAVLVAAVLVAAFRVEGRELGSASFDRALPWRPWPRLLGTVSAASIHPAWAAFWVAAAVGLAGGASLALAVLALGLGLAVSLSIAAYALARAASPDRVGAASVLFRAGVLALAAGALGAWS